MVTTLDHINELQQKRFEETISHIVAAVSPIKIICYGNRTHKDGIWSCFLPSQSLRIYTDYDLLIVTQESQPEKENELLDRLNKCEEEAVNITAVVHSMAAVKEALQKNSTFFSTACQKGVVVYDSGNLTFEFPMIKESVSSLEKIERHWKESFGLAERFYSSAKDCATNKRNDVAAFMLHQTVELVCSATIVMQMGYRPATHNLKRLLDLMENFTLYGLVIFPRITKEETELFNVLHRAYSDVRYKQEYTVSGETVLVLIERVKSLMNVAEELYHCKRKSLEASLLQVVTDIRELPSFESICIDTFTDVVLQRGESESIRIECDKDITHAIKTSVDSNRLRISTNTLGTDIFPKATLHITYTNLNDLVINHSGKITCKEPIKVPWLGIVQNGSGNINIEVNTQSLDVTLNKTGNVVLSGSSGEVRVLNHRSANFYGSKLVTNLANITVRGSGNVSIHVEDELRAELHGSGYLHYVGTPRIKSLVIEGTGKLKSLG